MFGTIPPPPVPNSRNTKNPNRVENGFQTNNTGINNVTKNVVNEDLLQLLDSRGGSHVTNDAPFDVDDFSSWKYMFLVYFDGLEPYLFKRLENGPYVPKSPASTFVHVLIKPQKQWSHDGRKLVNQDKRRKKSLSSEDEGVSKVKACMAIAEDKLVVGKANARSGQWVEITMKK
nr:hypothetical protein [Tanacetum cinerariifolium]